MISINEHEEVMKKLKTPKGCEELKARVDSLYKLSMRSSAPPFEAVDEIVLIAELALVELHIVRVTESRYDI